MAIALPAPTLSIVSAIASPTALPTTEVTSIAAGGGVSFANNGAILLRLTIGASGTCTMSVLLERAIEGFLLGTPLYTTGTLANSTAYIFGPFSPKDLNDANGNVNFTLSVYTGNAAGLYTLPGWAT